MEYFPNALIVAKDQANYPTLIFSGQSAYRLDAPVMTSSPAELKILLILP